MERIKARILKGIGGFYYCKPIDSSFFLETELIECKPRGVFRYKKQRPVIGDVVYLVNENEGWIIDEILERKNSLVRPNISNVDSALLCISVKSPEPNLMILDTLLVNCEINNIDPIICLTKVDLDYSEALKIKEIYKKIGYPVFLLSTEQEDEIKALEKELKNKSAFLAGNSGVGKSSLSNRLSKSHMEVGDLSKKLNRGKHTTRHVEMLETNWGGFIFDTPGFSTLKLDEAVTIENLKEAYPEFRENNCFYHNCNHLTEPKCEVKEKVKSQLINPGRYNRYKVLFNSVKNSKLY